MALSFMNHFRYMQSNSVFFKIKTVLENYMMSMSMYKYRKFRSRIKVVQISLSEMNLIDRVLKNVLK